MSTVYDDIIFQDDDIFEEVQKQEETWEILIIDDEEDVHQLTHFVLDDYSYQGKKLKFVSAYSAEEAKLVFDQHPNMAVIFLDVVMETNDAGLKLVEYIRERLNNHLVRIILRTGQAGYAPEKQVIIKYDINDYKNKTELTDQKLFTVMTSSLRNYSDIKTIESYRHHLEDKVAERTLELKEKNEILLQLNQQLTNLNKEKNEFLSIAAHDLKNPLSAIQSLAGIIHHSLDNLSKDKLIEFASMIEFSSRKMFSLIKNLLDVNAIESKNIHFSFNTYNFNSCLQTVLKNYIETAKKKQITLEYQVKEQQNYSIFVDENALYQILDNLISNAIKYSPIGKTVCINLFEDANVVRCEIQDQGTGIEKQEQALLFGKFARLTPQPTAGEHSTGLGLFIVKKLVTAMKGKVWCESEFGEGSKFIVEFQNPLASKLHTE
ncbi:ATP-binding response regulator [Candidatus Marithrix sp. Canyon 246]|uniref:ATP-binding response regulator n=1 Tax=Candidatus Marithrix sp. Canyon 246 TaxID=1827136 RepID=UPI00084A2851|nr:HAMP domain-containing sensor histidine kinase [Candidatus Marithrix sp. Canyon 246]